MQLKHCMCCLKETSFIKSDSIISAAKMVGFSISRVLNLEISIAQIRNPLIIYIINSKNTFTISRCILLYYNNQNLQASVNLIR